jgi:hypothetical protein
MNHFHGRFWLESGLAVLSSVVLLATIVWRDWIEIVFGADPDHGSGSLEWSIVAVTAVGAIMCSILARRQWRRIQEAG